MSSAQGKVIYSIKKALLGVINRFPCRDLNCKRKFEGDVIVTFLGLLRIISSNLYVERIGTKNEENPCKRMLSYRIILYGLIR